MSWEGAENHNLLECTNSVAWQALSAQGKVMPSMWLGEQILSAVVLGISAMCMTMLISTTSRHLHRAMRHDFCMVTMTG